MKYKINFQNKHKNFFSVSSMNDYTSDEKDVGDFMKVLSDEPVRKYITNEAMSKYDIKTVSELAEGILENSSDKWNNKKEYRFLVRDNQDSIVGMIGIDLKSPKNGEIWFYKISSTPSFMYEALIETLSSLQQEGIEKVTATFEADNDKSIKLLSRLGFKPSNKVNEMIIDLTNS